MGIQYSLLDCILLFSEKIMILFSLGNHRLNYSVWGFIEITCFLKVFLSPSSVLHSFSLPFTMEKF